MYLSIIKVPGGGVTSQFSAVIRFLYNTSFPELFWNLKHKSGLIYGIWQASQSTYASSRIYHLCHSHRHKEVICLLEHFLLCPALLDHLGCHINGGLIGVWLNNVSYVAPALAPHIAEKVGGDGPPILHNLVAVVLVQLVPHVSVKLLVQRLETLPSLFHLLLEGVRLIGVDLHLAGVSEPIDAGSLVVKVDILLVAVNHLLAAGLPPLLPVVLELLGVPGQRHALSQLRLQGELLGLGLEVGDLGLAVCLAHACGDGEESGDLGVIQGARPDIFLKLQFSRHVIILEK